MWDGELGRKAYHGECTCTCKKQTFVSAMNTHASKLEKDHAIWRKFQRENMLKPKAK